MLRAVRRRWWVFLAVIGLTVLLASQTLSAFPPTYVVEGEYLLTQGDIGQSRGIDSATVIATVADSRGFGPDAPGQLRSVEYEIGAVDDSSVINVAAVAGTAELANQGLERLLGTVETVVDELTEDGSGGVSVLGRGVRAAGGIGTGDDELTGSFVATAAVLIPARLNATNSYPPTDYTASVLVSAISAPQNIASYLREPGMEELTLSTDARGAAPLLTLTASGTQLDTVLEVYGDVETEITQRLDAFQADDLERGARPTVAEALARPDGPTLVEDNRRRPLAVVVLLGLLVAFGLSLSVDSMLLARARREREEQAEAELAATPPGDESATPPGDDAVTPTDHPAEEHASDEPASVGPGHGHSS